MIHARDRSFDIFEPTAEQQDAWMTMIETLAPQSIFSAEHSHYYGANVEGKARKFLLNPGGRGKLREMLEEMSSTENYGGAFSVAAFETVSTTLVTDPATSLGVPWGFTITSVRSDVR